MKQEQSLREQLQHKFDELPVHGQAANDWQQLKKTLNAAMPVGAAYLLLHGKLGLANKMWWLYLLGLGAVGCAVLTVYYPCQSGNSKLSTIKRDRAITKTDTSVHKHKTLPPVALKDNMARKHKTISRLPVKDKMVRRQRKSSPSFLKDSTIGKYRSLPPGAPKDTVDRKRKKLPPPYTPKDSVFRKHKRLPPPQVRGTTVRKHKKGFGQ